MPANSKQTAANRRNAKLSTGPKTQAGKAASSQNAVRHGLSAATVFVPPDQTDDFNDLQDDLYRSLRPVGMLEHTIFHQVLAAAWNLRRIARLKEQLATMTGVEDPAELLISGSETQQKQFLQLERYQQRNERSLYRGLNELQQLQTTRALYDAHHQRLASDVSPNADTAKLLRCAKQTHSRPKSTHPLPNSERSQYPIRS